MSQYADFNFGNKNLIFYDKNKVEIQSFTPEGSERSIRFFKKTGFDKWSKDAKIISRYGFSSFREPFEIEPWNQILIDEANKYGTLVDKNKEKALRGEISDSEVLKETKMSVGKIMQKDLIWVARGQMICHPESLIYGEVDEIWYHKKTDTYYIGDTKTSSSVDKMSYWYQLGIYIEILKALNPNKKISSIALIDWVKIKKEKWVYNKKFNESQWQESIGKDAKPNDPVYNAKWSGKKALPVPEEKNSLVEKNLEKSQILSQVKNDIAFIKNFKINSVAVFQEKLNSDEKFTFENNMLQEKYDELKNGI